MFRNHRPLRILDLSGIMIFAGRVLPLRRARVSGPDETQRGASAVEYGLIVAFVAAAFIVALKLLDVLPAVFEASACQEDHGYSCTKVP